MAYTLKLLREKIKNLCDGESDTAIQNEEMSTDIVIGYLKREILALLDEQEKELREIDLKAWVLKHLTDDEDYAVELMNAIDLFIEKEILHE